MTGFYRKRLALYSALFALCVLLGGGNGGGCVATPPPPPVVAPAPPAAAVAQLLAAHNRERAARGLALLAIDPKLTAAAQAHADRMRAAERMAHDGIGDGDLASRLAAAGYRLSAAGENVAWGQPDVPSVMAFWMASPGHRADVLGPFTGVGFGVAYGTDGDIYWCADFGSPR